MGGAKKVAYVVFEGAKPGIYDRWYAATPCVLAQNNTIMGQRLRLRSKATAVQTIGVTLKIKEVSLEPKKITGVISRARQ